MLASAERAREELVHKAGAERKRLDLELRIAIDKGSMARQRAEKAEKDQKRLQHDLCRARDECDAMVRWAERQAGQRAETEIDLRAELDETRGTLEAVGTEMKAARKEIEMLRRKLNEAEVTAADALSRRRSTRRTIRYQNE